jgi:hypothetical protein
MTELEDWDDEDEMGLASAFVLALMVGATATAVIGAAIAWNVASYATEAVRKVRRLSHG